MTPDEVRLLDNKNAIVFIRGERPVIDEKYDLMKHPNIQFTEDGRGCPLRPQPALSVRYSVFIIYYGGKRMKKPTTKRAKIFMSVWSVIILCMVFLTTSAFAADGDPIAVVNNLSDFIFSAIKAIGVIILGWGIVQVGMSIQSHDASQRSQGFLCLFGGLVIAFAKEILAAIGAV